MRRLCYHLGPISTDRISRLPMGVFALLACAVSAATCCAAQPGPVLVVPPSKLTRHLATTLPEAADLEAAGSWQLVDLERPDVAVPAQLVPAIAADGSADPKRKRLVADLPAADAAGRFRLERAEQAEPAFQLKELGERSLGIFEGKTRVLAYNYDLRDDPKFARCKHLRARGCYLHPVWGLNGELLSDDCPVTDHCHHRGIWWSWPHIRIDGKEYNSWASENIRPRLVRWLARQTGPVAAVLGAENGWFVGRRKVMIERVWLRVHRAAGGGRALDIELTWIPVDRPVTLWGAPGKSYGGLSMRFAPRSNTVITVPGGRTTEDLKNTRLAWADLTARFADAPAPSGAAVFIHPDHPDYPPAWLTRHYGILCVGYPGVKPKSLEPGESLRLSYRIWIHKTAVDAAGLQQAHEAYVATTRLKWQ